MSETTNYNYWCQECTCSKKLSSGTRHFTVESILNFSEEEKENRYCPNKLDELTEDTEEIIEPMKLVGKKMFNISSFNSKTKEEKQDILRKRSQDHYKKEILEKKIDMNRRAANEFKNLK